MDNMDLFDKYIKGKLSEKERQEFDTRLKNDKSFADDFKVYSATVIGICREAEQDNKDFEVAMKNISKEQLREIIGKKEGKIVENRMAESLKKRKTNFFRSWMWQAACWVVIICGAAVWVLTYNGRPGQTIQEFSYESSNANKAESKEQCNIPDLSRSTNKELHENLPALRQRFYQSEKPEEIYEIGFTLAMTYLRLNEREEAKEVLSKMITELSRERNYSEQVYQLSSILNSLK